MRPRNGLALLLLALFVAGCARAAPTPVELGPIPLDTTEPKYQACFNQVRERIKANWIYPRQAGDRGIEGEARIEFHIAKSGRVEFIELRHSSGTTILDDAALTAVKLAQPFPPVPDDIAKQTLRINGMFRYEIKKE